MRKKEPIELPYLYRRIVGVSVSIVNFNNNISSRNLNIEYDNCEIVNRWNNSIECEAQGESYKGWIFS